MVVQAMWPKQSPLLQLPGFNRELVETMKTEGIEEIADFVNMEDDVRAKVLPIPEKEMMRLAQICNRYPFVQVKWTVQDEKTEFEAGD